MGIFAEQIRDQIRWLIEYPHPTICKHAAAACLLSVLESCGELVNPELVEAVVYAEDEKAIALLDQEAIGRGS